MRSRQITFYSLPSEINTFQEWLLREGIVFIKQPIKNVEQVLDTVNSVPDRNNEWSKIYLTKNEYRDSIFLEYHEHSGFYYVDEDISSVVEFSRPEFDIYGRLSRCRLYFISSAYVGESICKKDTEFIDWADKLKKRFTKQFLVKFNTPQADYATRKFIENYNESMPLKL